MNNFQYTISLQHETEYRRLEAERKQHKQALLDQNPQRREWHKRLLRLLA